MTEPLTYRLLRTTERDAVHLELRDTYTPNDPDWRDWREGRRFDPQQRWPDWFDLMSATTGRGVRVRRARIVSEPVTDYIRFEHDVTGAHNIAAGEQVRWLARHASAGLLVPGCDLWVFDAKTIVYNHFDGPGNWVGEELRDNETEAKAAADAFDAIWHRAIPHDS